jgi:hypothetical protein
VISITGFHRVLHVQICCKQWLLFVPLSAIEEYTWFRLVWLPNIHSKFYRMSRRKCLPLQCCYWISVVFSFSRNEEFELKYCSWRLKGVKGDNLFISYSAPSKTTLLLRKSSSPRSFSWEYYLRQLKRLIGRLAVFSHTSLHPKPTLRVTGRPTPDKRHWSLTQAISYCNSGRSVEHTLESNNVLLRRPYRSPISARRRPTWDMS